jgi:two-component system, LytTR family, response regulator
MSRVRVLVGLREPLLRRRVRDLLLEEIDFELVAECGDGLEALEQVRRARPDLFLIDTAMPGLDGFEIVRQLDPSRGPVVVFLASGSEDAQKAFDVGALDFLLKPVDRRRFSRSMQRVRMWIRAQRGAAVGERLSGLLQTLRSAADYPAYIPVPSNGSILFLAIDEIDWIEGSGNYVSVHAGERVFRVRQTLASFLSALDPGRFRRIHRRTIVHLARIREVEPSGGGAAIVRLRDGTALRMSRGYRDVVTWLGADAPGPAAEIPALSDEAALELSEALPLVSHEEVEDRR